LIKRAFFRYNIHFIKNTTMMKAAVVTSFSEPLEIKQVPIPQVGPNDVLVKIIACGVCHSDLHLAKGGKKKNIFIRFELDSISILKRLGHAISFTTNCWS